jgi:pimeloyl-ACP methyl ester carboxylesterase
MKGSLQRASRSLLLTGSLLLHAAAGQAGDLLVLVHGYLGDAVSWDRAGVTPALVDAGWQVAGTWYSTPSGVRLDRASAAPGLDRRIYLVDLPSTAPLGVQASYLAGMLDAMTRRHPAADIQLVGHSAGGVVARLALVRYGAGKVTRLVTIASPHLGTDRAWQALDATDDSGLLGGLKRWLVQRKVGEAAYRTVQQSRGVLMDLGPPVPGSLLQWLNGQQHPGIDYVSIVRSAGYGIAGDRIVPAPSQDLNQVAALRGKARTIVVASDHLLGPGDAALLLALLREPPRATATP